MQTSKSESEGVGVTIDEERLPYISSSIHDEDSGRSSPYEWPSQKKIYIGVICSTTSLITHMSASMIAPALEDITHDLMVDPTTGQIVFSIFFLGVATAPLLVAALSETYGRRPVWLMGNIWYIIWNSLCPAGKSTAMMVVGRFLSASGASVGVTLTAPVLADLYQAQDRGKSLAIAGLLPFLGMALGPIVGGLATQHLRWPWLFWILSCFDAVCLVLGYFVLEETYGPVIARKAPEPAGGGSTAGRAQFLELFVPGLIRPLRFLFLRPVMTLCTIAAGAKFGVYTLILSDYASLWVDQYHQSKEMASLHYISISLGTIIGALVGGRLMDFIWRRMNARAGAQGATAPPEYRVPHMVLGAIPAILFLLLFGWAGHLHWHWLIVDMSIALFSLADCIFFQGLLAYVVDEFGSKRAASADAAMRLLSYTVGFAFPIFAPSLEKTFGYGVGISILCAVLTVLFTVMLPVLWFHGDKLRAMGRREEDT